MEFQLTSKDYAEYIRLAYQKIHENGDYITSLDAATGDGDHWANLDSGFQKLNEIADSLGTMCLFEEFRQIGSTMMSVIGGSSGILYGSAYLEAAKTLEGKETIGNNELYQVLSAMLKAMMSRGNAKPGWKTMIDCLYPAVECYKACLEEKASIKELLVRVRRAAIDGAENTRNMEAVKGRASYQTGKGVGYLDPGAVTMSYQLEILFNYALGKMEE